ncbi:MAG: hypothetical protein IPQ07_39180 [Myxococcales bacterium]|nr:hypothetical protein [Myxococcales bacterium]
MSYGRGLLAAATMLSACAEAGVALERTDASVAGGDAKHDGSPGTDSSTSADASCNPVMTELLMNEAFDGVPVATAWTQTKIDPAYPLVTTAGPAPVTPMTAPNLVWLGGFEKPAASNKDSLTQTILIPAGTTALTLTGNYWVQTSEILPGVYDHGYADLAQSNGTVIENVVSLDDDHTTTTWTAFSKTFAAPHAGETIMIKLSSAGDATDVSNFFFDSLSLKATHPASGCP